MLEKPTLLVIPMFKGCVSLLCAIWGLTVSSQNPLCHFCRVSSSQRTMVEASLMVDSQRALKGRDGEDFEIYSEAD